MSQGKSIFSSPNGSNGEAPANPFASLGGGQQKGAAASPFAAVTPEEPESPFGFAADEPEPELASRPTKLPEKRRQAPLPSPEENPFASAAAAPQAEAPSRPTESPADSPYRSEASFEAPAPQAPQSPSNFEGLENPLSAAAPELTKPARPVQPAPEPVIEAIQVEPPVTAAPLQQAAVSASAAAAYPSQPSQPSAAAVNSPPAGGQSTRQLELRAIFGSEGEMTRDEILTRAKGLPGIREVTIVGAGENMAVQTIGDVMSRFGYGGAGSWQMTCSGGVVDFISAENTTLAVLREGRYPAGVWETLMIVARELGKLS